MRSNAHSYRKGKGASGFIAYKNEKPNTAQTPSSEVEEPRRWTTFDDRKTAAEAKFTHDQEFQFKTIARRNKLLGLWAADQMGISGVDAEAYAKQVVIADFEEPGDADVLRKVLGDLTVKGIATDEHKVRYEMTRLLEEAKTHVSIE